MITTVDNYFSIGTDSKNYYFSFEKKEKPDKKKIGEKLEISLAEYKQKTNTNQFLSFFKDDEKIASKNSDNDLILSIIKKGDQYEAQTGNYVGAFNWDGLEVEIGSRFGNRFLERMLNFANDIYIDDVSVDAEQNSKSLDISRYILYYMFVQSLEKAFLLGVPKEYKTRSHHEMKLKGKIDVNAFIKKDIPFQGRISSTNREQIEIQEIIDVLYKTTMIIEKSGFSLKNIAHIKTHLKQHRSKNYISSAVINKALQSKALQNPIFSPYKKVLTYAKYIIQAQSIKQNSDGKNQTYGFLINVAELFEIYVTKLLQKEFSDWDVSSPKITLYQKQFFTRKIIPDIVMIKDKDVMVFDTKYKRMLFREKNQYGSGDVDRNDFFQINTYMSYYQNHASNYRVKVGGLLYPMEGTFEEKKSHSPTWFENANTRFIIDGIELSQLDENSKIADFEEAFINRIKKIT